MSYARWSADSSVYVFGHVSGGINCCGCVLEDAPVFLYSDEEVTAHFARHIEAGNRVPAGMIEDILAESADEGPTFYEATQ